MADSAIERRLQDLDLIEAPELWRRARSGTPIRDIGRPVGIGRAASAVVVAALLSIASLTFLILAFERPEGAGTPDARLDPESLRPTWTAEVTDAGTDFGLSHDDERVYVPTASGTVAFPKACDVPCQPAWRSDLLAGEPPASRFSVDSQLAVGDGLLAVTFKGDLAVFAADCRNDGGVCVPLWRARSPQGSNGFHDPMIGGGVVKVTSSVGEMPDHGVMAVAFAARCRTDGGACEPEWTGDLGVGTAYFPSAKVGGVFYQQVGRKLLGFASNCSTDGGSCEADFVVRAQGDPSTQASTLYGPVGGKGVLAIVSGDGNVYGFPEHCGTGCAPLWVGPAADYLEGFPFLAGDLVVVASAKGLTAFPLACRTDGGVCQPTWQVGLDGHVSIAFADDRTVVAADHLREPRVMAIETACDGRCSPLWSVAPDGKLFGVESDGRTVFAGMRRAVLAFPTDCSTPCEPVWRGEVAGEPWWLLIDSDSLIVASRPGDVGGLGLTLQAFEASA